ncbi:carbon-nitrogen hydrolase family protein [Marinobacterium stanieri]|uniref:carbon-nitrogen hydrolase family protein n=1 Tax=Marinobacterium stanieri TaxID=49186 RepID=UPI003A8F91A8
MGITHPKYKVAAVQAAPVYLDIDATVDKTIHLVEEAAKEGAKLIAFPETWIPGYPWWIWLGSHAWAIQRGFVQRYYDNSLSYEDPHAERIREAAKQNNITIALGFSERESATGTLYISQWLIGPDGDTIAKRRKIRPTHSERTVFGEGDGSDLGVHATELGRIGALNCWENLLSLNRYALYSQNEQVHIAAWPSFSTYEPFANALGPDVNNAISKVYAVEGACFVIGPSAVISQDMIDTLCDTPEKHELTHAGGGHAVIYGPDGSQLCDKLPETEEGILFAEIDLAQIPLAKNAMDPCGHYSRPDVMRLLLNKTPMSRIEHMAPPLDTQKHTPNESDFEYTQLE